MKNSSELCGPASLSPEKEHLVPIR